MCPRGKSRSQAKSIQPAKLWILLVGVNQYQDTENLASLQYSALDCRGLGEALTEATASLASKEVIIHHDFVSQRPQLADVRQSIDYITKSAGQDDTILFYFSGHGILDPKTQQVALCLADTDTKQLLTTGLPLNHLLKQLSNCAASQQMIWLDACHSGGMTLWGTVSADPSSQLVKVLRHKASQSKGFYALLSCDRAQQSWEFPELGHGVFTYYLMRGLRGEAADAGGVIEADALYQYVYHQTLRYIDRSNQQIRLINQQKSSRGENKLQSEFPLQTPKRIVEGFGKVVLGKRSQRNSDINPRQALIVDGGFKANSITLALSQILQSAGDFDLRYFPQTNEPWSQIKDAIATSLNAGTEDRAEIGTALLYLRGEVETTESGESWLVLPDGIRISRFWLKKILQNARATQQILILDCPGEHNLEDWIEDLGIEGERGQCLIAANSSLENSSQFADLVLESLQPDYGETGLPVAAWIGKLQVALAGTGITPQIWLSGTQGVIELLTAKNRTQIEQPVLDLGICPYMGLQAFGEAQSEYFYGRETLVQKLVNQVDRQTAIAVVGASGSGKSSAVQAGLMAQLRQGQQIPHSDRWWLGCFRPGSTPVRALAKLLADSQNREEQTQSQLQIEGLLYQGVEGFVQWLRSRSEPMVVLVIDQFEELYTLAGESERQEFVALILGAVKHAGDRFKLIMTVRADFVATCLENPELGNILQKNSVLVPPYLTEADYRHAIVKPAQQVGLEVESGLIEVLLQDLDRSAGDLPLLQFALQQLWEQRANGKLTLAAYRRLEGVKGALERQAQQVYDRLDPKSQECARWIFLNLTQLGEGTEDTRRRITKSDLVVAKYPEALVDRTLQTLTDAKLLVVNLDSGNVGQSRSAVNPPEDDELFLEAMRQEATVEVVHEILIRHWSSLRWWLEENRSRLRSQRQIEQAAILWLQKDKQDDFLLKGVRLAEAEEILIRYTDELSDTAKEYVASCIDVREAEQRSAKRRLRQAQLTAMALGILGLSATVLGVGAYRQKLITQVENIASLTSVAEAQLLSNRQLESLTTSVKAGRQFEQIDGLGKLLVGKDNWQEAKYRTSATLQQSLYGTQELNRFEGHSQRVNAVKVSQDGQLLGTASDDGTVKIWDRTGTLLETLTEAEAETNTVAVSYANSKIQTADLVREPQKSSLSTTAGTYFVSADDDRVVEFKAKSARQEAIFYVHSEVVNNLALNADEKLLATTTTDGKINIWNQAGILLQTISGHTGEVSDLEFMPKSENDSRDRLISTGVDKTIRVWQISARPNNQQEIHSVATSPRSIDEYAVANAGNKIQLWREGNNQPELAHTLSGHDRTISQIKYSADGQILASASWDNTVKLWDAKTGRLIKTLELSDTANAIAFSADGQTLILGTEANNIHLWNIATKEQPKLARTLTGHTDSIKTIAVTGDGKLIASAGYDNQIKLWTIEGELLQTIDAHNLAIASLAFAPDRENGNQTLASASWDNTVKLWSIESAGKSSELLNTLTGHQDGVTTVSFNTDGTLLATGSGDRHIKLWNTETGELIKNLRGHTSQINSLAFSNDDRSLISGEAQQGLYLWNLDLDNLLERSCDRLSDYLATNPNLKDSDKKLCL